MRTVNDMITTLKRDSKIIIPTANASLIPDLLFTLDVMCLPYSRREVQLLGGGSLTKLELRSVRTSTLN